MTRPFGLVGILMMVAVALGAWFATLAEPFAHAAVVCKQVCLGARTCQEGRCLPAWLPASTENGPSPRIRHGAVSFNGQVMIAGGALPNNTGALADAFVYNPSLDGWLRAAPMPQGRCAHAMQLVGGRVVVTGGLSECSNGTTTQGTLVEYTLLTNSWRQAAAASAANAPTPRFNSNSLALPTGDLLIVGGSTATESSVATGARWSRNKGYRNADCPLPGCAASGGAPLTFDANTAVYWGGLGGYVTAGAKLDLPTNTWSSWTPHPEAPALPVQFAQDANRWFIVESVGGACATQVTVHIFDKRTNRWTRDTVPAPSGFGLEINTTSHTVWTGNELFLWSAQCSAGGAGFRYQPPDTSP